jgi:hypothetical protein
VYFDGVFFTPQEKVYVVAEVLDGQAGVVQENLRHTHTEKNKRRQVNASDT